MCIRTSDFLSSLVHHIDKRLLRATDMLSNLCSNIVGRFNDQCIQTVLHGQDLSPTCVPMLLESAFTLLHSGLCKGHLLVHGGILYRHQQVS